MKKKFLSVLLSLAMLLTLLPAALAADLTDDQKAVVEEALLAQDYTEEEIAELLASDKVLIIDEDTELEEDFDGLVIVMPGCTLTIKGVKVSVGVVILPGAEAVEEDEEDPKETKVIVSADSEVGTIVVLVENAEVVIEADAQVASIVVDAAGVIVTIEADAKVETVIVGEDAEDVEINVSEDAEVGEIVDEGENATVTEVPAEEEPEEEPAPALTPAVEDNTDTGFILPFFPVYEDPFAGDNTTCCNNGGEVIPGYWFSYT